MNIRSLAAAFVLSVPLAGIVTLVCDLPSAAADELQVIQPEAIQALTRMGEHLRNLKAFTLEADTTQDHTLENGQTIQVSGHSLYQVQTPNKLTLEIDNDRSHRIYVYDGKSVTQYSPDRNMYAVFEAPDTIDKTIDLAKSRYGISLPIADLFYASNDDSKIKSITSAVRVGASLLDDAICNHYAYRLPGADVQLWIRAEGDPLPCEMVVTDTTDPARPRFGAVISIETVEAFEDGTFTFDPPAEKADVEPDKGASVFGSAVKP